MKTQLPRFLRTFEISHPIIQAPMAGASTVELAATVTRLGGIGSLAMGSLSESPGKVVAMLREFDGLIANEPQKRTVNVNFFSHEPPHESRAFLNGPWIQKYDAIYETSSIPIMGRKSELELLYPTFKSISDPHHATVEALKSLRPGIVSFHFGLPSQTVLESLQRAGIKIFVTVTNLEEFQLSVNSHVDGVVLQGWEAGGHRGNFHANDPGDEKLSTVALVKTIVAYVDSVGMVDIPFIIAAGGIHDAETMAEVLQYDIAAVQVGTVFLPTDQCTISPELLQHFQTPHEETLMTASISGRNLRTVSSPFLQQLHKSSPLESIPDYPLPYDAFKSFVSAANHAGKAHTYCALLAGANYSSSWKGTRSVEEVFASLEQ